MGDKPPSPSPGVVLQRNVRPSTDQTAAEVAALATPAPTLARLLLPHLVFLASLLAIGAALSTAPIGVDIGWLGGPAAGSAALNSGSAVWRLWLWLHLSRTVGSG